MKRIYILTVPLLSILLSGFITSNWSTTPAGVYGYDGTLLQLNEDGSFEFIHECADQHASGSWTADGKKVTLNTEIGSTEIPSKWKLDEHCPCLRSEMKKLEILRLCQDR
ncbi:MAG: hypothetical protein R2813_03745 [Flavobacteriales bacterium]